MRTTLPERWVKGMREHIPSRMIPGLIRYIEHGIIPGGFWQAVLENNLKEACAMADEENKYLIWDYVYVLYNYAPSDCWGSPERVNKWVADRNKGGDSEETTQALPQGVRDSEYPEAGATEAPIVPNPEG